METNPPTSKEVIEGLNDLDERIDKGIKAAVAEALERHKKLGDSIVIWRDGEIVWLKPEEIPSKTERIDGDPPRTV